MFDPKTNEKLECYASGNGALHFVWLRNGMGTGRSVTIQDAKGYLLTDEAKHFRVDAYRVCCVDTVHPVLVAPVKRISSDVLELKGKQYSYLINKGDLFFQKDNTVRECSLYVKTEHGQEVKNLNTILALVFFLNHEGILTEQKAGL